MNRRNFLKLLAAGGATAAGAYALGEYAPWLDYDLAVDQTRMPILEESKMSVDFLELIHHATLAASSHNSQPWKFACLENGIEIHPDYSRRLPVVDPEDRSLWISLGCALENLLLASRAAGYAAGVTYPGAEDFIRVDLAPGVPQEDLLFAAIPLRQITRSIFDGRRISNESIDRLQSIPLEPGVTLRMFADAADLEIIGEHLDLGNISQYSQPAFLDELIDWLRFNKKEAMASRDGLYTRCTGNPEVPRWLGRWFVAGTNPRQQADADRKKLLSSSGTIVVASDSEDRSAWVRTGQVYERLALTMTSMNIQSAFLNQPIEASDVRGPFQAAAGLGDLLPQLLVRFGYGNPMPRSLRRPVDRVLMQPG